MANSILSHRLINPVNNGASGSLRGGGRNSGGGEKRSRNGCQMCKSRRKKCPEDFNLRPSGKLACSSCFQKGLDCHPPSPQGDETPLQRPVHKKVATLSSRSHNPSPAPGMFSSQPSINFSSLHTDSALGLNQTLPPASTSLQSQPAFLQSLPQGQLQQQPITSTSTNGAQPLNDLQDAAWLNDFFKEFSHLSDPIYQDAIWLANNQPNVANANANVSPQNTSLATSSTWTATTPATSAPSTSSKRIDAPTGRAEYDRIVESDELDELLEKYKPLYEKVWRSTISVSEKDDGLMRAILTLSRRSKACRAASVSACLSLHMLMQRERNMDRPSCGMGFIHQLMEDDATGTPTLPPTKHEDAQGNKKESSQGEATAEDHTSMTYKWYQFAADEYERSGSKDSMAERLATLLNLRYTIIGLDGARAGSIYMEEIRKILTELGVSTHYLRYTSYCGTILGVMLQSTLVIDIFEAATKRHKRCAVLASNPTVSLTSSPAYGGTPSSSIATDSVSLSALNSEVLAQDLQKGPLYEYEFLSCLSCDIIEALLHICNLDADIHENLLSDVDKKARIEEVECMIRQARLIRKNNNDGAAFVRSIAVHEMWRQAVLISFYQRILNLGALAAKIQTALQEILSLADMLSTALTPSETWDMWMVWFLASTVAITQEQRKKCILYLEALGTEQAIMDNLVIIKQLWKASDETGYPQDWYAIADANGLSVCYAF